VLYGTRLLILGIGLGVLAGTLLSVWDPAGRLSVGAVAKQSTTTAVQPKLGLALGQENLELKSRLAALLAKYDQMKAGILLVDLDTQSYVDVNASATFAAASTIKLPILVAFFQDVDAGKIQLNEMLTMRKELVATEAGDMQYQPVNSKFSALQTATQMMVISDNTATNMLIDLLGGIETLNQRFQSWGLSHTRLQNRLPDVEGLNITTPQDLILLMDQVQQGNLVSMKSRDRLLDIMRRIENDSLLPQGLDKGATIAHKTGTIGTMIGDIGLIDTPTGKRFLASVLVQRPRDDHRATELIQQISKAAYQVFSQPTQSAQQRLEPGAKNARL
jgi:beta-lactamase class A